MTDWLNRCHFGDCRDLMRSMAVDGVRVQTCVTSPPYFGLRDYGHDGQLGLEQTPEEYIAAMVEVFRCVRDVLADDGTLWLNIGDSYCSTAPGTRNAPQTKGSKTEAGQWANARPKTPEGMKPKDLIGIPWMLAFALRADGWYLRQDIIWHKPNPMPESVRDRCTKAHEYLFLLSKSERYYFDTEAMQEPAAASSVARWSQDIASQRGSDRVPGKTNGTMKAVGGPRRRDSFDRSGNPVASHVIPGQSAAQHRARKQDSTNESAVPGATPHGGIHREGSEREPQTRNRRSVWTVATKPYSGAHFAVFPEELIQPCILAGAAGGGIVLDPFFGSGTTGQVAQALGRKFVGCEINPAFKPLQDERLRQPSLDLEAAC